MRRLTLSVAAIALLSTLFAACTEKLQTIGMRKIDTPGWQGAADVYVAPGWKVGDAASWDKQLNARAQHQNEYQRIGAR